MIANSLISLFDYAYSNEHNGGLIGSRLAYDIVFYDSKIKPKNSCDLYDYIRSAITIDNIEDNLTIAFFHNNCNYFQFLIHLNVVQLLNQRSIQQCLHIDENSPIYSKLCTCLRTVFNLYKNNTYATYHFNSILNLAKNHKQ